MTCDAQWISIFFFSVESQCLPGTGNNFNVYVFCDSGESRQKINSDDVVQWPEIQHLENMPHLVLLTLKTYKW